MPRRPKEIDPSKTYRASVRMEGELAARIASAAIEQTRNFNRQVLALVDAGFRWQEYEEELLARATGAQPQAKAENANGGAAVVNLGEWRNKTR